MDSIADLMVRIKNATRTKKESVEMPHSKMKEELLKLLQTEGYVMKYEVANRLNKKILKLYLKYDAAGKSIIEGMKRVSRSGLRSYVSADAIPRVRSGFGTAIISTPKGLMTDAEAREKKSGGEVVCFVW